MTFFRTGVALRILAHDIRACSRADIPFAGGVGTP
jgi:hypothetical protein